MAVRPAVPFTVPLTVLKAVDRRVNGVRTKDFEEGQTMLAAFRTFGGTEKDQDGLTVVEDTAVVDAWFTPGLCAGDRVRTEADGAVWDVLGTPEDIEQRHQWMRFKVRRAKGGA